MRFEVLAAGPPPGPRHVPNDRVAAAHHLSTVALPVSLVAAVAALVSLLVMVVVSRSRAPRGELPPTLDLGGEPPAVAHALVHRARPGHDAVVATLVDLAARRHIEIEQRPGGAVFVRRRTVTFDHPLEPFERMLMEHVASRTRDGACPAEALTLGPAGLSVAWRKLFAQQVVASGARVGLLRRRYGRMHLLVPSVLAGLAIALGIAAVAVASLDAPERATTWHHRLPVVAVLLGGVCATTIGNLSRRGDHVLTASGLSAAEHWLAVRAQIASVGTFTAKPAASVAVWDRMLAYATALDLTPRVVAELPLITEHSRRVWSDATGTWRRVRVRYWSLRPGRGRHPLLVALQGGLNVAVAVALVVGAQHAPGLAHDLARSGDRNEREHRPRSSARSRSGLPCHSRCTASSTSWPGWPGWGGRSRSRAGSCASGSARPMRR
jgi:hypothetical protein